MSSAFSSVKISLKIDKEQQAKKKKKGDEVAGREREGGRKREERRREEKAWFLRPSIEILSENKIDIFTRKAYYYEKLLLKFRYFEAFPTSNLLFQGAN